MASKADIDDRWAKPLEGLCVVEICHSVAGPFAGSIFAQLGAEVIKVENPKGGDHARGWGPPYWHGKSSVFQSLNRDKLGVSINLGDLSDAERLKQFIIERADVVLQNLRPGSAEKSVLSSHSLLAEKPTLIYCNIGAFGATGPLADQPGYDPLMQAFGGIMSITGEGSGNPVRVGPAVVDIGSGMWAAIGVLAALRQLQQTGKGCVVDTSLFETALAWMSIQVAGYLASGELRRPMGSGIPEIVPHQAFRTRNGHLMIAAGNDGLFVNLCAALNRPDLAADGRFMTNDGRVRNRTELIPMIESETLKKDSSEWQEILQAAGVPNAPIQSIDQVVAHPQTQALQIVQPSPDLDMQLVGLPLCFNGRRPPFTRNAPSLGEHNEVMPARSGDAGSQEREGTRK
ncbi:MAG: CoA transferase [Rhizobiaceae bacterium]|nr:CoA transferase [Rhizobiaceae bacterium]